MFQKYHYDKTYSREYLEAEYESYLREMDNVETHQQPEIHGSSDDDDLFMKDQVYVHEREGEIRNFI